MSNNPVKYVDSSGYKGCKADAVQGTESPVKGMGNGRTYQTYTKTNPQTGEVYSGRTSGNGAPLDNIANRDARHHMNDKGLGSSKLDKSSPDKDAIRGREQQLIEQYGGAKSQGGTSGNSINRIYERNPNRQKYLNATEKEFGR